MAALGVFTVSVSRVYGWELESNGVGWAFTVSVCPPCIYTITMRGSGRGWGVHLFIHDILSQSPLIEVSGVLLGAFTVYLSTCPRVYM